MSVLIKSVDRGSPAERAGITAGDMLVSINGNEIVDVLDYRFYQNEKRLVLEVLKNGKLKKIKIRKGEYDETGMEFETYLMDKQHSCRNKCIFCFIDQLPDGMRESLYFKDDDSRLSFLFGNYITLTNLSEHEVERIIKMHISPINVSVHTTNPGLRVKMMKNRFAGEKLALLKRFSDAGIALNCQLVLCPGWNDGDELRRSLSDLLKYPTVGCIACVPVGLTKYREGLEKLEPFSKERSAEVIDIIDSFGDECFKTRGERICYAADEFYLKAEREIPEPDFYGDFLQLENGVGLWSLFKSECEQAVEDINQNETERNVSVATGVAAAPLISYAARLCEKKVKGLHVTVHTVINNFFGENITVAGLVTGGDIIEQLSGKPLGSELLIPSVMLRQGEDCFLDDITVPELEEKLAINVKAVSGDGYEFIDALLGNDSQSGNVSNVVFER